ncbi:hybrid sensor histidine kinase/response regulator [Lusitaniella coriacea LEGE 07157]|uniref:histidine kinase n=1 Tax=Lusitaniella coriacea LEGE 07157 TaxID=945747 RepID=A0A8J7J9P9_9CYAN|nr:response regulator [Lusitaniella coriacea]MBE9115725.1 hybrid sensor histidine kinase/response regulator [Lusitaniella coriacea LEGE 07157]
MSDAMPFILIVDDNSTNLSVLSKALKLDGYKVRMAMDGEDALAQVERNPPELILLDIEMPKLDGFETCRRLQANPKTQGIPIIFMTALSDTANKVKGLSLGAVDYITKPFEQEEVLARVKVHWRLKRLTDTLEQQVAERTQALQQAQLQLVQQEKLSALGQLVTGVAHEINNPIGCIVGNVDPLQDYISDLFAIINLFREKFPQPGTDFEEELEAFDLDYIQDDLPKLIQAMKDGGNRIRHISTSLRTFSRTDKDHKVSFNLYEGLDSTILILKYRLKANVQRPAIKIIKDYGDIPEVQCFPGQLNQVFMNLIANAIDALDESNKGRTFEEIEANPNRITIQTEVSGELAIVRIKDNAKGMPDEVRAKIFEQGFTTKGVGKGTGLGLAIAHQIIVEKHGGTLTCHSEPGKGTAFIIKIPSPA